MRDSMTEPAMPRTRADPRNTPTCSKVRRNSAVRKRGLRCIDCVAGSANRLNKCNFEWPVHLRSESADMGLDNAGARVEIEVPYLFKQHRARNHLAGVAHQVFQQPKFARLQIDPPIPTHHSPSADVQR